MTTTPAIMDSGIYYPHKAIRTPELLKTSLLFHERLYILAPRRGFLPEYKYKDAPELASIMHDAFNSMSRDNNGCQIPPDMNVAQRAWPRIQEVMKKCRDQGITYASVKNLDEKDQFDFDSEHLCTEMWEEMDKHGLIGPPKPGKRKEELHDFPAAPVFGQAVMDILVDTYAGHTLQRITDVDYAHTSMLSVVKADRKKTKALNDLAEASIKIVHPVGVSLEALVKFRLKYGNHPEVVELRKRFRSHVVKQANAMAATLDTPERNILLQAADDEMRAAYLELARQLGLNLLGSMLERKVTGAIIAAGTTLMAVGGALTQLPPSTPHSPEGVGHNIGIASAASGMTIVAAALGGLAKQRERRDKILQESYVGYLHFVQKHA